MKFKENIKNNKYKLFLSLFSILAFSIIVYIIFKSPVQGVADQGDFDRVMSPAGLSLLDSDKSNPDFIRFYKYTVTDYKITAQICQEPIRPIDQIWLFENFNSQRGRK